MTDFVPSEKGVSIRQPSTANLMLDARDGVVQGGTPSNFTINKAESILNGFFTRIGVTEHVLEWREPNISAALRNNVVLYDVSGSPQQTLTIPDSFLTVEAALKAIVALANDVSGAVGGVTLAVAGANGLATITASGGALIGFSGAIPTLLGFASAVLANTVDINGVGPGDLRPYRYLDFVSANLTYNQDLKDSSTSVVTRDVLARWYFAYDQPPSLDAFGFPILMGYTPFVLRRIFNPPKQIKWAANQPVGQISFQVYPDAPRNVLANMPNSLWEMTLQVSEV